MTTLLIDGNNLTMTALFAMARSQLSAGGVSTGPLMVVINKLTKLVRDVQPDRLLVAWDGGISPARLRIDAGYKANRKPITEETRRNRETTFSLVGEFCALAGVPQLRLAKVEADDVIAAAWATMTPEAESDRIVVVSSDRDFLQLLGPNPHGVETQQIRFRPESKSPEAKRGTEHDWWTEARFTEEFGYTPTQKPLVMALTGDEGDGVHGVPGLGDKRAVALLRRCGWDLQEAAREAARTKPIDAARVQANHALVDLRSISWPVAVPQFHPVAEQEALAYEDLDRFLSRYELVQIQMRLHSGALWRPSTDERVLPGRPLDNR